jgi:hypothetical protein
MCQQARLKAKRITETSEGTVLLLMYRVYATRLSCCADAAHSPVQPQNARDARTLGCLKALQAAQATGYKPAAEAA